MNLYDIIARAQGGNAIANMAKTFGLTPEQAEAAVKSVLPELSRGIERNTLSRGGIADLLEALGSGRAARTMENPAMFGNSSVQADGNAILGHILGTNDASRAAAQRASLSSGLGESLIKMLLPYIAQLLMGALTRGTQGGLGDILSKIPGLPGSSPSGQPMPQSRPRQQPRMDEPAPQPFPRSPVEQNDPFGTGNGGRRGGFENQQPLPLPTDFPDEAPRRNPYGDLSDIIRGGQRGAGASVGGNPLWTIIRDMLGGALGFSTKGGVMGWIFRAVVLRYGWSILRAIFGGLIGRR